MIVPMMSELLLFAGDLGFGLVLVLVLGTSFLGGFLGACLEGCLRGTALLEGDTALRLPASDAATDALSSCSTLEVVVPVMSDDRLLGGDLGFGLVTTGATLPLMELRRIGIRMGGME